LSEVVEGKLDLFCPSLCEI